ncbi:MAG: sulfotransferase domain-containing protein [Gammaproteobacteria bacterium]
MRRRIRTQVMNAATIPQIDRTVPRAARIFVLALFYGLVMPLNWVFTRLGFGSLLAVLMRRMGRKDRWSKVFADYEPTEHDVIVSTFAKSGTNWMMQIAHQIAFRGEGEYANIHDVVSWPDMNNPRRRMSPALDDSNVWRASPTGLRVIKTHLAIRYVPYSERARYAVVIRDPKEVFVSSYFFAGSMAGPLMPASEVWFDLFVSGRFPLDFGASWAEHTAGYWALRHRPNVLVLLFRDMKRDLDGAVGRVADLLGVELTPAEFARVVERSSFSYMKAINDRFSPMAPGALPWAEGFTMMREGHTGRSDEILTPEQQARIDTYCQAELDRLGSDFPYAEVFGSTSRSGAEDFGLPIETA